jgi:hypothetical protein
LQKEAKTFAIGTRVNGAQLTRVPSSKSFLVLFFKKELLFVVCRTESSVPHESVSRRAGINGHGAKVMQTIVAARPIGTARAEMLMFTKYREQEAPLVTCRGEG